MSHHHHHHDHDHQEPMTFSEKVDRLLEHWIQHNDDHARSYREWAEKLTDNDLAEAAPLLEEAADLTMRISERFEQARARIKSH